MRPSLDDRELYERLDPSGMRGQLEGMAVQWREAARATASLALPARLRRSDIVLIAGMGTSAVAGEMAADLAQHLGAAKQIVVWRDYGLPAWANREALVVACSQSGVTAEPISAFEAALERGAGTVVVSGGGELADRAREERVPVVPITSAWGGRHSLGPTLVALLNVLREAGVLTELSEQIEEAGWLLELQAERYAPARPEAENPAKALARRMWGRFPVVYAAGLLAGVARRWKYDVNENAKAWALAEVLPELQHNSIVGYENPRQLRKDAHVSVLSSSHLSEALRQRVDLTEELLAGAGVSYERVDADTERVGASGLGPLAHQVGMVCLGSWAAYYLALLYGVDPVPVAALQTVRQRVKAERKGPTGRLAGLS
ncbi:MAG: hypothetical protein EXR48_05835 [Dehalococcoidia bacterium]|nr:hypothetical protein [Dehalococcoidia bacterium]